MTHPASFGVEFRRRGQTPRRADQTSRTLITPTCAIRWTTSRAAPARTRRIPTQASPGDDGPAPVDGVVIPDTPPVGLGVGEPPSFGVGVGVAVGVEVGVEGVGVGVEGVGVGVEGVGVGVEGVGVGVEGVGVGVEGVGVGVDGVGVGGVQSVVSAVTGPVVPAPVSLAQRAHSLFPEAAEVVNA